MLMVLILTILELVSIGILITANVYCSGHMSLPIISNFNYGKKKSFWLFPLRFLNEKFN